MGTAMLASSRPMGSTPILFSWGRRPGEGFFLPWNSNILSHSGNGHGTTPATSHIFSY